MSTTTSPPLVQAPRRRGRWSRVTLVLLALAIGAPLGMFIYSYFSTRSAWDRAEAEAERDLRRWRLLELEEDRGKIPDAENSAILIVDARRKAGGVAVAGAPKYTEIFEKLTPTAQLNEQQVKLIEAELAKIQGPLAEVRKLKDMPRGRIPVTYADDFISTLLPDHHHVRTIGDWLQHDAMLLTQDEEYDKANQSCQALLHASRVFCDDPFMISLLIRFSMQHMATSALERVLAQGQVSEPALQATQVILEKEMRESGFVAAVRGERAGVHHLFDNIREGKIESTWLSKTGVGGRGGGAVNHVILFIGDKFPSTLLKYYPEFLGFMNRYVEIAKLPPHERRPGFKQLDIEIRETGNPVVRLLAPAMRSVSEAELRSQAMLRASTVALACERYRLKHKDGAWPATLDDLVKAKLIDAVPLDPFDGQPLRYVRHKDGVVVYSVGHDLKDGGGNINRDRALDPGVDIGFRLWIVDRRRQPALPPVKLEEGD